MYVDFAGSVALRERIHRHLTGLAYSCAVGASHVATWAAQATCPAPAPPCSLPRHRSKKRNADWGAQGLNDRLVQAWQQFSTAVQAPPQPWLVVQHHQGSAATQAVYQQVLGGQGSPRIGHMASLLA